MSSPKTAPASPTQRSRVTNGSDMLPGVDGRSALARRYRDLVDGLTAEFGPALTEGGRLQIRNAASLQLHAEELTARLVRGEPIEPEAITRAANGANRAILGLRRRTPVRRRRGSTAGLTEYLSGRQHAPAPAPEAVG